jgi:hypothetical protein
LLIKQGEVVILRQRTGKATQTRQLAFEVQTGVELAVVLGELLPIIRVAAIICTNIDDIQNSINNALQNTLPNLIHLSCELNILN